jgi:hypothetical protein
MKRFRAHTFAPGSRQPVTPVAICFNHKSRPQRLLSLQ